MALLEHSIWRFRNESLVSGKTERMRPLTVAVKDEASSGRNAAVHSAACNACRVPLAGVTLNGATYSQLKLRGTCPLFRICR
jgi:hypothetical protein